MTSDTHPDAVRKAVSQAVSDDLEKRQLYGGARAMERVTSLAGYRRDELDVLPPDAINLSSGPGNPLSHCLLEAGMTILDVGCGAGLDLILAVGRVGPQGKVVGLDINGDICLRARANASAAGAENVEVLRGLAEKLPQDDASVDVIITNGLLSLSPEKDRVFGEMLRVLHPKGIVVISEVVVNDLPKWAHMSRGLFHAGVAGALEAGQLREAMRSAGFAKVELKHHEVLETHLVEALIDGGIGGIEMAGCSASGAIMGSEAAAALTGIVGTVTISARPSEIS